MNRVVGYVNPDGSGHGNWSQIERRRQCDHGGRTCPRPIYQAAPEPDRTMTIPRLTILGLVGALMWVAVFVGIAMVLA